MRPRRSPTAITLVLIGTATLSGCGKEEVATQRDVYRTRADCQADWGSDPNKCEPAMTGTSHVGGYYYGPIYRGGTGDAGSTGIPRYGSRAMSTTQVTRGGLGSSASSHSSHSSAS
ncbi:MAG TPA: hypothetical protein VJQ51_15330 [Burkholderiales bacterium]|nr:hypothetical protein [Burkholderiales bacterium]